MQAWAATATLARLNESPNGRCRQVLHRPVPRRERLGALRSTGCRASVLAPAQRGGDPCGCAGAATRKTQLEKPTKETNAPNSQKDDARSPNSEIVLGCCTSDDDTCSSSARLRIFNLPPRDLSLGLAPRLGLPRARPALLSARAHNLPDHTRRPRPHPHSAPHPPAAPRSLPTKRRACSRPRPRASA